jgi:UDP-glucose 4-epimerase
MKKKCLILGGGGFIGSHLAKDLLSSGYSVRVFDVKNFSKKNLETFIDDIEVFEGDFHNPVDIALALKDIDYLYHLISSTIPSNSILNPAFDIESNVIPSIHLLQICLKKKIKKVIFISSGGTVYGIPCITPIPESHNCNPISSYGISKRTIENYFTLYHKLWQLDICIFRLSNPYGERQNPRGQQGVIPVFIRKAIKDEVIEVWGDGEVIRDYIYINDVTSVLIRALSIKTPELIYNLGSGIGTSLNQILQFITSHINPDQKINYLKGRSFDVPVNVLDTSLLSKRFGITEQTSLNNGMEIIYQFLLNGEGK